MLQKYDRCFFFFRPPNLILCRVEYYVFLLPMAKVSIHLSLDLWLSEYLRLGHLEDDRHTAISTMFFVLWDEGRSFMSVGY